MSEQGGAVCKLVPLNNIYTFYSSMFDTISSGKHTCEWCVRKTEVLACGCLQT